jgi:hypothetical protein
MAGLTIVVGGKVDAVGVVDVVDVALFFIAGAVGVNAAGCMAGLTAV